VVSLGARAVALAAAQRGKPYRWGAAGPYAFDCSGLVQWVYRRLGVNLPRTTYAQAFVLRHVSHAAARPGDLIFVDHYQHVGIYLGLGAMWHAPHTGSTVRISPIWDRNFVVARVR
jgi:cell wall-associated NlpC family hydrolase